MQSIRIALVRHGRACAGWDTAVDPALDDLGAMQARDAASRLDRILGDRSVEIVSSPLLRCQQTADAFAQFRALPVRVCAEVSEIPSPRSIEMAERVDWLRMAMQGTWSDLGHEYVAFRNSVVKFVQAIDKCTAIFSHFIAINAVIGAITGDDRVVIRSLDNCSVTLLERDAHGDLTIAQTGHEADTLIR